MAYLKTPRLLEAAKEFNIGKETMIDFLKDIGLNIYDNPSARLTEEMYHCLQINFAKDKKAKHLSDEILLVKGSLIDNLRKTKNELNIDTKSKTLYALDAEKVKIKSIKNNESFSHGVGETKKNPFFKIKSYQHHKNEFNPVSATRSENRQILNSVNQIVPATSPKIKKQLDNILLLQKIKEKSILIKKDIQNLKNEFVQIQSDKEKKKFAIDKVKLNLLYQQKIIALNKLQERLKQIPNEKEVEKRIEQANKNIEQSKKGKQKII